jgi:hypothetical protein
MNLTRLLCVVGLAVVLAVQTGCVSMTESVEYSIGGESFTDVRAKAEKGDAKAQCTMGMTYAEGMCGLTKDEVQAVSWYRKAAEQNWAEAQYRLGLCYTSGRGVAKDQEEAVKWHRKAAEQNVAGAQNWLGGCYANGLGVAKDRVEAVRWFRKAAEQNDAAAQYNLGVCYEEGRGVPRDDVEAVKWFLLAARESDDVTKKRTATLKESLSPEQIAEAVRRAKSFKPVNAPAPKTP